MQYALCLFHACKCHDLSASTKNPYKSCYHRNHFSCAVNYGSRHYRHFFLYANHYDNYYHFAFDGSLLPSGPHYFEALLNPLNLIIATEQQHPQPLCLTQRKGQQQSSSKLIMCQSPSYHFVSYRTSLLGFPIVKD